MTAIDEKKLIDNHKDYEHTAENDQANENSCCSNTCTSSTNSLPAIETKVPEGHNTVTLKIEAMDCPTEERLIRTKLEPMENVYSIQFNLIKRELYIVYREDLAAIKSAIRTLGMEPIESDEQIIEKKQSPYKYVPLIISGLCAAIAEGISLLEGNYWVAAVFAIVSIALCGLTTYKKGWIAIKNKNLNINALMSVAVTGAVLLGEFPEAALVMFLFTIAELIEAKSLDRARNAIEGLLSLTPDEALVEIDGAFISKPVENIQLGAKLRVIPGARFSLDGVIIKGASSIDESPITGESMPIDKTIGDAVYAGSINQEGEIEYTSTTTSDNSTLMKIVRAIEQAQSNKAPVERFIDRFSSVYTPLVFVFAILVAIISPFFGVPVHEAIYNALVILIIACPCALVISTPVTIVSGLTSATRQGILIKGGVYLEQACHLKGLAFDKTGTITEGKPHLVDEFYVRDPEALSIIAYSLTKRSDHPISKAIANFYENKKAQFEEIDGFEALLGRGTKGSINGVTYYVGNQKLMEEQSIDLLNVNNYLQDFAGDGRSILMLADESEVLAVFSLEDTIKASSLAAIKKLQALGLELMILSGDQQTVVDKVATQVNIDRAFGNQLPEDKMNKITDFAKQNGKIGMIGDGINDAPALAKADIGFAMGAMGSDTAIETADVAIMDDDLMKLPLFLTIARKTVGVVKQNIAFALGIKFIFLILALFGVATMWMAVFADVGTSLLVVMNGLRLLKISKKTLASN